MAALQTFRQYSISQDQKGGTVELWRCPTEVVCLAADNARQIFVELHVATGAEHQVEPRTFQQAVQLAATLRHRHLLGVVEGGEDEGACYYVSEFLDGERFETWLARCNPLPPWLALQAATQLADALCAVAQHPRLLAGVNLHHSGIALHGGLPSDLCARICDLGLSAPPPRQQDPRQVEARLTQDMAHLLVYMLTGTQVKPGQEASVAGNPALSAELSFLLNTLLQPSMQHHPRTMEQLRSLLDRCARELGNDHAGRPDRLTAALRPRLPLHATFPGGASVAEVAADECTVDTRSFDALDPYRYRAVQRNTRAPLSVQLLPADHLLPLTYAEPLLAACSRISTLEHPHLLRLLAWEGTDHPDLILEEGQPRWSLEHVLRLKGRLSPDEAVAVLRQLEDACREAESCGLAAVIRCPSNIYFQFTGPGGEDQLPSSAELSRLTLDNWPAWRLRVRAWPVTLNFTQPERFNAERLIHREPGAVEPPQRHPASLQPVAGREFALLAAWMLGGTAALPDHLRPLIYDQLHQRVDTPAARKEFLDRVTARVERRELTAPVALPAAYLPPASQPPASKTQPAPGIILGAESMPHDAPEEGIPVGFAEALFGAAKSRTATVPVIVPAFDPADAEQEEYSFLDGPQGYQSYREPGDYDPEMDPTPAPNRLVLILLVVLIAAFIAALAAHLSGTAFWLK